jgi:hypothetical protein
MISCWSASSASRACRGNDELTTRHLTPALTRSRPLARPSAGLLLRRILRAASQATRISPVEAERVERLHNSHFSIQTSSHPRRAGVHPPQRTPTTFHQSAQRLPRLPWVPVRQWISTLKGLQQPAGTSWIQPRLGLDVHFLRTSQWLIRPALIDCPEDLHVRPSATGGFFQFGKRLHKNLFATPAGNYFPQPQTLIELRP